MSKPLYDCVLYDFDGTLANSLPIIIKSQVEAYEKVLGRCDRSYEDLRSYVGLPLVDTFSMHDDETRDKLLEAYFESNFKYLYSDAIDLFDGVMDELQKLKDMGVKQGIVSSKRRVSLDVTLKAKGLEDFFDVLITKEDTTRHKPDPDPLFLAADRVGVDIKRTMYVGDAIGDIKSAINAGAASVFVNWSDMPHKEILDLRPTYVIDEMKELSCIIFNSEL